MIFMDGLDFGDFNGYGFSLQGDRDTLRFFQGGSLAGSRQDRQFFTSRKLAMNPDFLAWIFWFRILAMFFFRIR